MTMLFQQGRDMRAPALAQIGRVFNRAGEIEEHRLRIVSYRAVAVNAVFEEFRTSFSQVFRRKNFLARRASTSCLLLSPSPVSGLLLR